MNHKYHVFVTEYLKWGDQVLAYKNAYKSDSSYKSLQSAANRLLNHPEVAKAIYESEARIRGEVEIAIANRQIKEVLTIEEKRSLLKQIATGSIYIEQKYKGKNCTQCSQYITSNIKEMLWAIREDSKTAGHYPYKLNGKWIIPAFPEEEEIKPENLQQFTTTERSDLNEANRKDLNYELTAGQQNTCPNDEIGRATTEEKDTTPLLFLGGDIGASASGGDKRQSGWLTPGGQETQDENIPENDNKIQQTGEYTIDNQSPAETHNTPTVNPSGRIITRAELKELLHPSPKPKLMPMVSEQHE